MRIRRVYVYAYACPCALVNTVSGPFFREGGRSIPNIVSSRLQHAHSVYNYHSTASIDYTRGNV